MFQYELATGRFPYPKWNSVFDQLTQVVRGDPPQLSNSEERRFSPKFISFVNLWWGNILQHDDRFIKMKNLPSGGQAAELPPSFKHFACFISFQALQRTSQKGQSTKSYWWVHTGPSAYFYILTLSFLSFYWRINLPSPLQKDPFIQMYEERSVDVAGYVCRLLDQMPASPSSPMYMDW